MYGRLLRFTVIVSSLMLLFVGCMADRNGDNNTQVIEIRHLVSKLAANGSMDGTKGAIKATVRDVHDKLTQLHRVIDHLQARVRSMEPVSDASLSSSSRRDKLSKVVSDLSEQNLRLSSENRKLKTVNTDLVRKLRVIEVKIKTLSSTTTSSSSSSSKTSSISATHLLTWVRDAVSEVRTILSENGLEHYLSPRFSPLVAGIVCNNMILLPLSITLLYLFRFVRSLTLHSIIASCNAFDLGIIIALSINAALLLDDPLQGLRHISPLNLVFVLYVLAGAFAVHVTALALAVARHADDKAARWKLYAAQIALKVIIANRFHSTVWVPVVDNDEDAPIAPGVTWYVLYAGVCIANVAMSARAARCKVQSPHKVASPFALDSGSFDNVRYHRLVVP